LTRGPLERTLPTHFVVAPADLLNHETHLPAEQGPTRPNPRFPRAHGHEEWSQGPGPASRQGPQAADPIKEKPAGGAARFPRTRRLRRPAEFKQAFAAGRRFGNELFAAAVRPTEGDSARLGLAIAARNVGNAVSRNRVKRQVREQFRLQRAALPPVDIVISARAPARTAPAPQLREALQRLWKQINEAWAQRRSNS
jgi:ribonuclease P protein component